MTYIVLFLILILVVVMILVVPDTYHRWPLRVGLFLFAFLAFVIPFGLEKFNEVDPPLVVWAVIFLGLALTSLLAFIFIPKETRIIPQILVACVLLFGVAFLAFAFTYGRVSLDNEEVISVASTSIKAIFTNL